MQYSRVARANSKIANHDGLSLPVYVHMYGLQHPVASAFVLYRGHLELVAPCQKSLQHHSWLLTRGFTAENSLFFPLFVPSATRQDQGPDEPFRRPRAKAG